MDLKHFQIFLVLYLILDKVSGVDKAETCSSSLAQAVHPDIILLNSIALFHDLLIAPFHIVISFFFI